MKLYYIVHPSRNWISYPFLTYMDAFKYAEQNFNYGYKIISIEAKIEHVNM